MKSKFRNLFSTGRLLSALCAMCVLLLTTAPQSAQAGTLFAAADTEDFAQVNTCLVIGQACPDRIAVVTTTGPTVDSVVIITTDYMVNGMADAGGQLLTGTPQKPWLRRVQFDGTLISSLTAPALNFGGNCCNEEMLFVPQLVGDPKVYHAKFGSFGGIREIDPVTGVLVQHFPQSDLVGMALVNGEIWVTRWSNKQILIWDPLSDAYTLQFDLDVLGLGTLGNAGALAWDPVDQILWLGTSGGRITPFSLAGNQLGPSAQPLGAFSQTIDGLTFLGEVTPPGDALPPVTSNLVKVPDPAPMGVPVLLTADVDDTDLGDSNISAAEFSVDAGAPTAMTATDGTFDEILENVTGSIPAFTEPGVYDICVNGTDAAGNQGLDACMLLPVYDPDDGFVTGGGFINSVAGAYLPDETLAGTAKFGFVAKYNKGATIPNGQIEFQIGDLNFHSIAYEWLVVAGQRAHYKGTGTINGEGIYDFMLFARDGKIAGASAVDGFRIRIRAAGGGAVIYDNVLVGSPDDISMTAGVQDIAKGSIVIHAR